MIADLSSLLLKQYQLYPRAEIQDLVKLLFQNEFGPGHMVKAESFQLLQAEYNRCWDYSPAPLAFEDIGNGLCRLHLAALDALELELATVNRFFVHTANTVKGNRQQFEEKLSALVQCCPEGLLPFPITAVESWLKSYRAQGYPPVSHSEVFRNAYAPAYRVVKATFRDYLPLFSRIDSLLKSRDQVKIAIDGRSGAGKSTLAALIGEIYDCNIFHLDDFFLPLQRKTRERLLEPGGNVDYERFFAEVLKGLAENRPVCYRPFNCAQQILGSKVLVSPRRLNIIEGAYSLHPALADAYDLKVFLEIDPEEQSLRILERNGREIQQRFLREWIPLENRYLRALKIKEQCDLVFH